MWPTSLDYIADEARKGDRRRHGQAERRRAAGRERDHSKHRAIIFNGDNYAAEWHAEAEKRGLPNLRNTVAALPALVKKESIAVFEKFGVLNDREVRSRYEIYMERYCKDINSEARCALSMAKTMILPAAYRYQGELATVASSLKTIGKNPHLGTLDTLTGLVAKLEDQIAELDAAIGHKGARRPGGRGQALSTMKWCRRCWACARSPISSSRYVADDLWPLPTYREILFIK